MAASVFFFLCPAVQVPAAIAPRVVILNSYHPGFVWSDAETAGLLQTLRKARPRMDLPIEYLDARRHPDSSNRERVRHFLASKYRDARIDLVVCLDNDALEMLLQSEEELFPGAPIVFAGVSDYRSVIQGAGRIVTGVAELPDYKGNFELMLSLHPDTREILIIHDTSLAGLSARRDVEQIIPYFARRTKFRFTPPSTYDELMSTLSGMPRDSLVLLLPYLADREKQAFPIPEGTRLLSAASKVPIYGVAETRLGHGILGGLVIIGREHGRRAAAMVLKILAGENPALIPVDTQFSSRPVFDFDQITRFGLPMTGFPSDSTFLNQPVSIFETHRKQVWGALAVIVFLGILVVFLSISGIRRRQAEAAMRKSEARYRLLSEHMGDVIWTMDLDTGRYTFVSQSALRLLGFTQEEAMTMTLEQAIAPASHRDMAASLDRRLTLFASGDQSTRIQTYLVKQLRKDGSTFQAEAVTTILTDETGRATELLGVTRDITERYEARVALQRREEQLRLALNAAKQGLYDLNLSSQEAQLSPEYESMIGYEPGEINLTLSWWLESLHPDDRERTYKALEDYVNGLTREYTVEFRMAMKNGGWKWILSMGKIVEWDEQGRPTRMIGTHTDINQRKQLEETLLSSQYLLDHVRDSIHWLGPDGELLYVNKGMCRFLGYTREELLNMNICDIDPLVNSEFWQKRMIQPIEAPYVTVDTTHKTKDGRMLPVEVSTNRVRIDGQGFRVAAVARDISERKEAEKTILEREATLKAIFRTAPVGIGMTVDHIIRDVNDALCRIAGYSRDELIGRTPAIFHFTEKEYIESVRELFAGQTSRGPEEFEARWKRKDGVARDVIIASAILGAPDPSQGTIFTALDITERKRVETALRDSEERFRAAFENAVIGRALVLPHGGILQVNEAVARILGVGRNELKKRDWHEFIHPDFLPSVSDLMQAIQDREKNMMHLELKLLNAQGGSIWVRISGVLIREEKHKAGYLIVDIEDISHRKQYEDRLHKYEHIVSASKDMMALIDRDYVLEAVNTSFLTAWRTESSKVIGNKLPDVIGPANFTPNIRGRFDQALTGETVNYQEQTEYPGVGRRIMEVSCYPFFDENGSIYGLVANWRDITETRNLESKLVQSQKMEAIGLLAGGIAHEINNPINGIMNYAQLIIDRRGRREHYRGYGRGDHFRDQTYCRHCQEPAYFRQARKNIPQPGTPGGHIVAAVASLIRTLMRHDQIDLVIDVPKDLPRIKCRSQQIQQVIMNLMTNARDALNEKYPRYDPDKRLVVSARQIRKEGHGFLPDHDRGSWNRHSPASPGQDFRSVFHHQTQ